ncbi:Halobacterial output domain-containing protein [Vibrio crassostreae]|uniref:hypothetical protein n=1 Tax=Vibrio crassostreae TaxID=246167 RepID=UPI0010537AF7|nr:hypothetical protein [Vibrio crassostreae]TCT98832.1 hypothetical protein EDB47_1284 [Vibrio crassostreae]CAK2326091.1 Halobacterial output domain-containing protein [Vibrio crassostreae]CAK2820250.1 Halobacterial output domain-containing protein [Vibrio crassostreae]CAK2905112.1 Halobacterial output domain-containing protein [Vibrio crassostreae]CAK3574029.1 Halobacterial output domain-containing protein [Vibrio crassostreae]
MTDPIQMQDIDVTPQTQDLLTLGELKEFIDQSLANGSTEESIVYNTGIQGVSVRLNDAGGLCLDEYGYEPE